MAKFGPEYRVYRSATWDKVLLALLVSACGILLLLAALIYQEAASVTLGAFVLIATGLAWAFYKWNRPDYVERLGSISAENGALTVGWDVVVEAATGTTIHETPRESFEVEVFGGPRAPRVVVELGTRDEAEQLRQALRPGLEARPSFRVAASSVPVGRMAMAAAVALVGAGGILGVMLGQPTYFLMTILGLILLRVRALATIGADGIVLDYLGRKTFIPFHDVVKVESDYGVLLHRRDGSTMRIRETLNEDVRDRMLARIESAREAALDTTAIEQLLGQGDRDDSAWREELHRLATPGYRHVAIERDRLWEVVENPGAEASARLGAMILLRGEANADDRTRLTRIGEEIASPELRDRMFDELGGDPEEEDEDEDARMAR